MDCDCNLKEGKNFDQDNEFSSQLKIENRRVRPTLINTRILQDVVSDAGGDGVVVCGAAVTL